MSTGSELKAIEAEETAPLQSRINKKLLERVRAEVKARAPRIKLRNAVELGLEHFISLCDAEKSEKKGAKK